MPRYWRTASCPQGGLCSVGRSASLRGPFRSEKGQTRSGLRYLGAVHVRRRMGSDAGHQSAMGSSHSGQGERVAQDVRSRSGSQTDDQPEAVVIDWTSRGRQPSAARRRQRFTRVARRRAALDAVCAPRDTYFWRWPVAINTRTTTAKKGSNLRRPGSPS